MHPGVYDLYIMECEKDKKECHCCQMTVSPHGELEGHSDLVFSVPLSRTGTMKGLSNLLLSFDCSC